MKAERSTKAERNTKGERNPKGERAMHGGRVKKRVIGLSVSLFAVFGSASQVAASPPGGFGITPPPKILLKPGLGPGVQSAGGAPCQAPQPQPPMFRCPAPPGCWGTNNADGTFNVTVWPAFTPDGKGGYTWVAQDPFQTLHVYSGSTTVKQATVQPDAYNVLSAQFTNVIPYSGVQGYIVLAGDGTFAPGKTTLKPTNLVKGAAGDCYGYTTKSKPTCSFFNGQNLCSPWPVACCTQVVQPLPCPRPNDPIGSVCGLPAMPPIELQADPVAQYAQGSIKTSPSFDNRAYVGAPTCAWIPRGTGTAADNKIPATDFDVTANPVIKQVQGPHGQEIVYLYYSVHVQVGAIQWTWGDENEPVLPDAAGQNSGPGTDPAANPPYPSYDFFGQRWSAGGCSVFHHYNVIGDGRTIRATQHFTATAVAWWDLGSNPVSQLIPGYINRDITVTWTGPTMKVTQIEGIPFHA